MNKVYLLLRYTVNSFDNVLENEVYGVFSSEYLANKAVLDNKFEDNHIFMYRVQEWEVNGLWLDKKVNL